MGRGGSGGGQPPGKGPHERWTRRPSDEERAAAQRTARFRRRRALGLFGTAIALFGVVLVLHDHHELANGSPDSPAKARVSYSVGVTTCTFTDRTRATPDFATGTSVPGRVLLTEIRYPSLGAVTASGRRAPASAYGPFPTVFFAHGYDLTPDSYSSLLDTWVRAGYVVVAPFFPDTNADAIRPPGSVAPEQDDVNQPGDIAFVTQSVLSDAAARRSACPILHDLVAPGELALAGQSDGGETVAALAYDANDRVPTVHYRAALVLSGEEFSPTARERDPYRATAGDPALLVVQSATDTCNPPQFSTKLYDDINQRARWFLLLKNAYHLPPYDGSDGANFAVVANVTKHFLALEFAGHEPGASFLALGTAHATTASLTDGPPPTVTPLEEVATSCYLQGPRP